MAPKILKKQNTWVTPADEMHKEMLVIRLSVGHCQTNWKTFVTHSVLADKADKVYILWLVCVYVCVVRERER